MLPIGWVEIAVYGAVINLICFVAFAWDKNRAKKHGHRLSERSLLLLCALGGSLGGVFARHKLRHKTVKEPFSTIFGIICVVHIGAMVLTLALLFAPN